MSMWLPKQINYAPGSVDQGGPGVSRSITNYYGTPYINMTAAQYAAAQQAVGLALGAVWWSQGVQGHSAGNAFMVVRAIAASTLGELVTFATPTTGTVTSATSTLYQATTNINNAATVAVNGDVDNWFYGNFTGAALPQLRRIKANTSSATASYTVSQ